MNSALDWDEFRLVKAIADTRSLVGAAQALLRQRLRKRRAHSVVEGDQGCRGAVGGFAGEIMIVDALVEFHGAGQLIGGLVAIGEGEIAVRLGQLGVVSAQQAHGGGGLGRFSGARFHQPRFAGNRRGWNGGTHRR